MSIHSSGNGFTPVRAAVAAIIGSATFMLSIPAFAAEKAQASDDLEEVQVTGTRIQRPDYESPNPITSFDAQDLQKLGIVNVSDAMTQIPQNVSQFTPANTGGSAFFIGSTLANLRGLNPFFGTRTLTLVDSRRFIPTTQGDAVDLNFVPSNLISRMDVVTGGASAAYGSGAISGVVNVLLDKKLQGVKLDADFGTTTHGDGDNYHVGLAGGTDFAGGKGHIVLGGEYQKSDAIQSCSDARDWCAESVGLFNNDRNFAFGPTTPPTATNPKIPGLPNYFRASNIRANQTSSTGVIYKPGTTGAAGTTWQFNAAGTDIVPFAIGQTGLYSVGGNAIGGDGDSIYKNLSLYPHVERKTAMTHVDYDLTEKTRVYGELSYGQVQAENNQWAVGNNTYSACVKQDNAYLGTLTPAARSAVLAAATGVQPGSFFPGNSPFSNFFNGGCVGGAVLTKNWYPQDDQGVTTDTKVTRGVIGFSGDFGGNWSWDAYYQYGKTTRDQIGRGYFSNWRLTMALDSVLDPRAGSPTFNQPICRAVLPANLGGGVPSSSPFGYIPVADPSLINGCQPLNPFGTQAASAAAMAYAFGSLTEHDDIRQDVLAGSISGRLWDGWGAGPLSAAFGLEYRKDKLNNDAGDLPLATRTDFSLQYGDSFAGHTQVTEAFGEFEMPLLKDLPASKMWTLNAAVRQAQYKTTGGFGTIGGTNKQNITTWKLATVWDPVDTFRVRGSYSRDIRAPNFRELFYSQSIPPGGIFGSTNNPWINAALLPPGQTASDATYFILNGNPEVKPEKSKTVTAGFIISPTGWAAGMHFSADYYQITLKDGLSLGGVNVIQECFNNASSPYCSFVTFGPGLPGQESNPNFNKTNITSYRTIYGNLSPYKTKGIDFSWNYNLPLADLKDGVPGSVALSLTASHTLKTIVPSGRDVAGQTGGDQGFLSDFASSPDWSGNLTASYLNGGFVGTVQMRWVSDGILDLQNPKTGPGQAGYNAANTYSVDDNTVPNYFLFNLNGSYDFKWFGVESTQVFVSVNNVLDKRPPFSAGAVGGVNATYFDALGRNYRLGFRLKF